MQQQYDKIHNYFLNLNIKLSQAISNRKALYNNKKKEKIEKIVQMLILFGCPQENIDFIKKNFPEIKNGVEVL